ncbi:YmfK family protein [Paenibacillus aurantius]|uniref:YmfK family protein n=1 Tax=Paenibacillus aurantius TaxID=2918900 RepID=A0AA96RKC1_9BACL|nr:YmfK family protein [Paenibacillus aurantius]WJH37481.1 YmfK family protein [Paenibacillus sp. CC-CFT747]WNQ14234.1 YmfK family protein [Paenibacillus aurantius]
MKQWYMEYKIHKNRPGLLGDIASLMGMLEINIITINGVEDRTRGMLLQCADDEKIDLLGKMLKKVDNITINAFRAPKLVDILAVRHGRYIERDSDDRKTFRFTRDELGLLVDFLGEIFKREGNQVIGLRGMPRVGKTESIIAGSVCSNKRWTFVSSTLLRQTVRSQLSEDEMNVNNVFIIDGIVSTIRSNEKHYALLQDIMGAPSTKVIEHPDIFIRESEYDYSHFDYIIELRNTPDEEINYETFTGNYEGF